MSFCLVICIITHGAPPPPHCLLFVSPLPFPLPIPKLYPCPCQLSYLISPPERHTLVLVVVVVNSHSLNSECKTKLVFTCCSQGRSFLIIPPRADPHTSLHPFNFTFHRFPPNQHAFSHSDRVTPSNTFFLFLLTADILCLFLSLPPPY